ncbi:MAG: AIR synthase-related protein [Promethearchaeota archaeon]
MADLEGLARALLRKHPRSEERKIVLEHLVREYQYYKKLPREQLEALAEAVVQECEASAKKPSDPFLARVLEVPRAGVTVGAQGVGCRGMGDFFVHRLLGEVSQTSTVAYLAPSSLDDAGAVRMGQAAQNQDAEWNANPAFLVSKMEGMHSRLSDFPFLAGFHVTRAALRDLLVKGARPVSVMVDVHLGDDADVGKLFDFIGGVTAVCELANVPVTAGSTLRIGGDMVIGTRMTGGVAAVGIARRLLARRNIVVGDAILMTEGAGGGTVATTALYGGQPDAVAETLNVKFLDACGALLEREDLLSSVRCMTDVTNGGLRGDLYEINHEANVGVVVEEEKVRGLVNPRVLHLLESTKTDYLGVSLDALLVYCDPVAADSILRLVRSKGVRMEKIGQVTASKAVKFRSTDGEEVAVPRFRESAYTPLKKAVGEYDAGGREDRERRVREAVAKALEKRRQVVDFVAAGRLGTR